jgi:hypothetical protein
MGAHIKIAFPVDHGPADRLRARFYREQTADAQEIELRTAGCDTIVQEHGSGTSQARPTLSKLLRDIGDGDTLVVVRLDRLALGQPLARGDRGTSDQRRIFGRCGIPLTPRRRTAGPWRCRAA